MRQIEKFSDERHDYNCSYCGGQTGTRDHIPSKIFLDVPYPENLPVVPACSECNQDFSLHEEYVACLIESAKYGTTNIDKLRRKKIRKIFEKKPLLKRRIEDSKFEEKNSTYFNIEGERLKKVILKLVKGHARFEHSSAQIGEPQYLLVNSISNLTEMELESFFSINKSINKQSSMILPELGSRAFQRFFISESFPIHENWIEVQENNYYYLTEDLGNEKKVKIIIGDFLAVEAIWYD